MWEALEFGAIPVYLRCRNQYVDDTMYFDFLRKLLPELKDTSTPEDVLNMPPEKMEAYRQSLMKSWQNTKKNPFVSLDDLCGTAIPIRSHIL